LSNSSDRRILDKKDSFKSVDSSLLDYFQPENKSDQETLKEFDESYRRDQSIDWYTRETCIYKILNKALRTQNIDQIVPFRIFIGDLNQQLSVEHELFLQQQKTLSIEVYRGQLISVDEVNRFKVKSIDFYQQVQIEKKL
jgi:hypothetical protein